MIIDCDQHIPGVAIVGCCAVIVALLWSTPSLATPVPPIVSNQSVTDVTASSATLQADVNAGGTNTQYHFEYGPTEAYGTSTPIPDGDVGSGLEDVVVSRHVTNLEPGLLYHYRIVVLNQLGSGFGSDQTFTTQAVTGGLVLPDARQWEQVSPPNKYGAGLKAIWAEGVVEAAEDGSAVTYLASGPIESNPEGNSNLTQVLSTRDGAGWHSRGIVTPSEAPVGQGVGAGEEYRFFSPDLSKGIIEQLHEDATTLPLTAEPQEKTIYRRDELRAGIGASYLPLVTKENVLTNEAFGGNLGFVTSTQDLSHVILTSQVPLLKADEGPGLYEWTDGQLRPISWLPGTTANGSNPVLGLLNFNVRNAISGDGSRVFWSKAEVASHLYMRDSNAGMTVQVDRAQGVPEPPEGGAKFQLANLTGSKVFFTDWQRLTVDSTAAGVEELEAEGRDLYVFDVEGGELTDLTVDSNSGEHANVQGMVIGSSEDGSSIYFIAKGVLTSVENGHREKAVSGGENLYVRHYNNDASAWEEEPTFIGTLSNADRNDWARGSEALIFGNLVPMTARVSPNGRYLAFMSERKLTGYDNRDAKSNALDQEVFLYDASANRVVCVSCNPTGSRPSGIEDNADANGGTGLLVDGSKTWVEHWLAGSIPGWTPVTPGYSLYQSRYLSDDGRLFFNSADGLVPEDSNHLEDVYEYQPKGDDCVESSPTFVPSGDGCVALISSGVASTESAFMDASEAGEHRKAGSDVFFLTKARLAPQDTDTAFDVYDARECESCVITSVSPPPCITVESCRTAPSAQPTIFGAPSSATFLGTGNLNSPVSRVARKTKSVAKAKKHKARRNRHRRHRKKAPGSKRSTITIHSSAGNGR